VIPRTRRRSFNDSQKLWDEQHAEALAKLSGKIDVSDEAPEVPDAPDPEDAITDYANRRGE
jgi:hypothetical protein